MMAPTVYGIVLLWAILSVSVGLNRIDLYRYGSEVGDHMLVPGDESKDVIEFPSPFQFYRRSFGRAYVRKFARFHGQSSNFHNIYMVRVIMCLNPIYHIVYTVILHK